MKQEAIGETGQPDRLPIPDPTTLTTEALRRDIGQLRELVASWRQSDKDVNAEIFARIAQQFELVERQRVEQKIDSKQALDAALAAAKEGVALQTIASEKAIAKSETSTAQQIEQLRVTFNQGQANITREVGELKERVGRIENIKAGVREGYGNLYAVVVAISVVLGIVGFVVGHALNK